MKKRFIATLLVSAVAVSGVIGLSACGIGSVTMPKGEEVTKEVWESAFTDEQAEKLTNYTASVSSNATASIKGTYKEGNDEKEITVNSKISGYMAILYNEENQSSYMESTMSSSSKTTDDGETENEVLKATNKTYTEKGEKDNEYWTAAYTKAENKNDNGSMASEAYWKARKVTYSPSNNYASLVSSVIDDKIFANSKEVSENTKAGTLSELYELFEYSGGAYTATLYSEYEIDDLEMGIVIEYKITLSFKDGYLIGYSSKVNTTDTYEDTDHGVKFDYTIKGDEIYAVSAIGSTDPTRKGTGDIAKAIEKAKEDYKAVED